MQKRALLVGINDYEAAPLRGCINDVNAMKKLLLAQFGFEADHIKMILDRDATKHGIETGLEWLAADTEPKCLRVFHFAGHGHFVPDKNGDEPDGSDEALVPYDYQQNGFLIDDKLKELYAVFPEDCNLTLLMDCCHSGSIQRDIEEGILYRFLPNSYVERKAITAAKRKFHEDQREFVLQNLESMRGRDLPREEFRNQVGEMMRQFEKQRFGDYRVREGNILMAGCQSDQTAADAKFGSSYGGAFTNYFIDTVKETNGQIVLQELMDIIGKELYDHGFRQIPQLECNEGWELSHVFAV